MSKQRKWSAAAKFEIALKGETPINDICTRYQVAPSQVHAWKKIFLEQGEEIFKKQPEKAISKKAAELEKKQTKLYETIGELTVERDFLNKS